MLLEKKGILISIVFCVVLLAHSRDLPIEAERGESIFLQKCASCHTIGEGRLVGPDLKGVTERRDESWLKGFIKDPAEFFNKNDKIAAQLLKEYNIPMPASGLSEDELNLVLSYLRIGSETEILGEGKTGATMIQGDASIGRDLFTGTKRFQKGGPPCISCHSFAGIGVPGGALGPDLTKTITTYGRDGLSSVLSGIPFPTMLPIYQKQTITPDESKHLIAFIESVDPAKQSVRFKRSAYIIASGFIVFIALMQIVWGSRLRNVRKSLIISSIRKGGR